MLLVLLCLPITVVSGAWVTNVPSAAGAYLNRLPASVRTTTRKTHLFSSAASNDDTNKDDDDDFMSALRTRVQQVQDRDTQLPIMVLDAMLPGQVLKLEVDNPVFQRLISHLVETESMVFGMIGFATLSTTGETMPLQNGVEVTLMEPPTVVDALPADDTTSLINPATTSTPNSNTPKAVRVHLKAGRRFRIINHQTELTTHPTGGWTEARVEFLDSEQEEEQQLSSATSGTSSDDDDRTSQFSLARAIRNAAQMDPLIEEWIMLARENERFPGQIDQLLKDLGTSPPPPDQPTERALWVGALINPLPGMGVSMEIRPQLLMAKTAEERVLVALNAIEASIHHMDGTQPLF